MLLCGYFTTVNSFLFFLFADWLVILGSSRRQKVEGSLVVNNVRSAKSPSLLQCLGGVRLGAFLTSRDFCVFPVSMFPIRYAVARI